MTEDFNIRDRDWVLSYLFHLVHSNLLFDIADSFNLLFSQSTNLIPTRYSNNSNNSNSVIDLIFFWPYSYSQELNNHSILPECQYPLDHAPLVVNISIINEFIQNRQFIIIKNSKEEENFIFKLIEIVKEINISCLESKELLKVAVQEFGRIVDYL